MKGVEAYCWYTYGSWSSGLLIGTNRYKTIEEVKWLQDNLPCSISIMKEILSTYSNYDRTYMSVFIVSVPPIEQELTHTIDIET